MNIKIPDEVSYIIETLESNGYEAYMVGGCVRDSILGKTPEDFDICTSALPEQTMECFSKHSIIETGLQHGTVTLILNRKPFEITAYRVDGIYTDNRHPSGVEFVRDLKKDLSRRDFTINAMAYNPKNGLVDFFGGVGDINDKIIKCVGDANKRFEEDALRIMRAMRFASTLGFEIDSDTAKAMDYHKALLNNIAVERIAVELNKLITGVYAGEILMRHTPVITEIIPEISPMIGFKQNTKWHYLDVWQHTLKSIVNAPADVIIRLTMLFHDIGKPFCYTQDSDGVGHFKGHQQLSRDTARKIMSRLKYDNNTLESVSKLVLYHDSDIEPQSKHIKRWLNKIGEEGFRQLIEVKRADKKAQNLTLTKKELNILDDIESLLNEIIAHRQCFSLKDLALNGSDLIAAGISEGAIIGEILKGLADMVIDEQVENDRVKLLEVATRIK